MLSPKVLQVSAVAVITVCLFVSQAETGLLTCDECFKHLDKAECPRLREYCCSSINSNIPRAICGGNRSTYSKNTSSSADWSSSCARNICQLLTCIQTVNCHNAATSGKFPSVSALNFKSRSILPVIDLVAYTSTAVLSLKPNNSSIISTNNRQDAYTSTVVLHLGPKSSSTFMTTDYQPGFSDRLLAGVLSVVGILCIAAVAIVVVLLIIIRTTRKKAVQIERVRECNCYEEVPNNNSNRNPNTATATQPNAGCVSGRLLPNPVYSTSPSQEEPNTTPLYQGSSFDAEAPSLMNTYERVLTTSPGASDELCNNGHSPAPYEIPIPHPTKCAVPVAVESDSEEYTQLERSHVYATLEPFIAKHEDMEEQNDDYSRLHYQ